MNKFKDVTFYDKNSNISDDKIGYVIVVCRFKGKWVFVRHKQRDTWEIPGGHRENGETVLNGAKRELFEETGADKYQIKHVGYWSLIDGNQAKSFGAIFFVEIESFGELPNSEIAVKELFDTIPNNITYPQVHPKVFNIVLDYIK